MARRWQAGDRVRLTDVVAWPERKGCVGTVVAPPEPGIYPDHRRLWEIDVLVLLDDDPLASDDPVFGLTPVPDYERGWTCVVGVDDLEPLAAGKQEGSDDV